MLNAFFHMSLQIRLSTAHRFTESSPQVAASLALIGHPVEEVVNVCVVEDM